VASRCVAASIIAVTLVPPFSGQLLARRHCAGLRSRQAEMLLLVALLRMRGGWRVLVTTTFKTKVAAAALVAAAFKHLEICLAVCTLLLLTLQTLLITAPSAGQLHLLQAAVLPEQPGGGVWRPQRQRQLPGTPGGYEVRGGILRVQQAGC
jgi:hypothetical protein